MGLLRSCSMRTQTWLQAGKYVSALASDLPSRNGWSVAEHANDAAGFASATDRSVAPPTGLSTLGSSPARFQAEPPACYRAPWRLPGPDFHRQATTSF